MTHLLNHSTLSLHNLIVSFVLKWQTVCMWDHTWIISKCIIVALWTDQEKNRLSGRHQKSQWGKGWCKISKWPTGSMTTWKGNRRKVLIVLIVYVKCTILCTHIETILGSWRAWWSRWSWWPLMKRAAVTLLLHMHRERFLSAISGITSVIQIPSELTNHSMFMTSGLAPYLWGVPCNIRQCCVPSFHSLSIIESIAHNTYWVAKSRTSPRLSFLTLVSIYTRTTLRKVPLKCHIGRNIMT